MFHKPVEVFPKSGGYRQFRWNKTHTGDDYKCAVGEYVCAVLDGEVVLSEDLNGFGSLSPNTSGGCIIIKHTQLPNVCSVKNFFAIYGHLNRWLSVGTTVTKGQVIGTIRSFSNGGVACPHLHFGIYTGSTIPHKPLGYRTDLYGYHDPDAWLFNNAVSEPMSISADNAEWKPILVCEEKRGGVSP